jgi:lipopolysaccharide/colanic/teichoic acid biosynthesis glycosyltransferase
VRITRPRTGRLPRSLASRGKGGATYHLVKRVLDVIGAGVGLVVLAVPMLLIALWIRVAMGAPVLYSAVRPGLQERPFVVRKFRTMSDERDAQGAPLPDEQRRTKLGNALRATSLDELPQLVNVLAGHMSLVGPRPLLCEYLDRYSPEQARRHEVKPGLTGWQQVNGRNSIDWERKLALDVWYVDNASLWLDVKILLRTVVKVVRREGIDTVTDTTMPEFRGSVSP